MRLELAKQSNNCELARIQVTQCNHNGATFQHKRQHLQTLLDQVKQKEQEAHVKTKAAVDLFSSLTRLVIQLKQDIQIAKDQLQVHHTILYNIYAAVLDKCSLNKTEMLAKMEE